MSHKQNLNYKDIKKLNVRYLLSSEDITDKLNHFNINNNIIYLDKNNKYYIYKLEY